ncbi:MAG: tRNA (adenosine(37)-N6)-dimethylallyltransferase MiaA [Candidatus Cloacimonetes bacterium]|nr:tRNA (adenosine(37)-N6)-dimethylallyltransferase MiaA [Candidatus Cloacimonadota bacterium]
MNDSLPRIVTIQGPTAAGKSELALRLATELGAHIVSADSRQVYRLLDIGTAKPTATEREQVPHHLIDVIYPEQRYSAGRFAREAMQIITRLSSDGIPVLVAGGTGFYIRALVDGLFRAPPVPVEMHERLCTELKTLGGSVLHERLASVDPTMAERLPPQDGQRIVRAIEVFETTGRPMSELWREQQSSPRYRCFNVMVNRPRQELYERIDSRYDAMLAAGLVDELREVLAAGYPPDAPGLHTVGYRELLPHLLEGASLSDCAALTRQHTRNYAKRQLTWFRNREFDLTTKPASDNFSQTLDSVGRFLSESGECCRGGIRE